MTTHNVNGIHFARGDPAAVAARVQDDEEKRVQELGESLPGEHLFNELFSRFVMTFTEDGKFIYKDFIADFRFNADFLEGVQVEPVADGQANRVVPDPSGTVYGFTLELTHLRKFKCWDVSGDSLNTSTMDRFSDGASTVNTHGDVSKSALTADLIYQCFKKAPLKYIPLAEGVVKRCFKTLTNMMLPLFQLELADSAIQAMTIRELTPDTDMDSLVLLPGIVVGSHKTFVKGSQITAQCRKCGHVKQMKLPMWRGGYSLPKFCEAVVQADATGADEEKCPMNPYDVMTELSTFLETQTVKFQERPEDIPVGDIPRSISLYLTGVHVRTLRPGMRKYVLGVYSNFDSGLHSLKSSDAKLRAPSIHLMGIFRDPSDHNPQPENGTDFFSAPEFSQQEVNAFKAFAKRSDLFEVISRSIAPSIYGHHDVKRSIACMLFGGTAKNLSSGNKNRADIHILLLGDPSVAKSQFLRFACDVAPRGVYTSGKGSSAAGLTAAIVKDIQGNFALEGGAMVLADGGIVCIDEFDKMRDDDRVAIHEAMEQQTISIAKAVITTVWGTKCSVLSAANPTFGSFDISKDTAEQHDFETTILSRFDLIWLIKDEKDYGRDKQIASHIFNLFLRSNKKHPKKIDEGRGRKYNHEPKVFPKVSFICEALHRTEIISIVCCSVRKLLHPDKS